MTQILRGITWDHPRGFESLVNSNKMLEESLGVTVRWEARSLLEFGDQHISEFYEKNDLMVIDHPHVPDAVHAGAVIAFDEMLSAPELFQLKRTSVGESHASYNYRGKQWALANDAAAQVSAPLAIQASRCIQHLRNFDGAKRNELEHRGDFC